MRASNSTRRYDGTSVMSGQQRATSYDQFQAVLDLAGLDLRASEVHGMLCGEICRRLRTGCATGVSALMGVPEDSADGAGRTATEAADELMEHSLRALDAGMQFFLLLPDDEEPLEERTAAVADWARGFVLGLLRGDEAGEEGLEGDSAEFVQDLFKISEAGDGGESEDNERALTEIEEYMRVGVQLVFEGMQPGDDPGAAAHGAH